MRRYLVTLDLRLPDNASDADYVKALLEAVPTKASLVFDGNEPELERIAVWMFENGYGDTAWPDGNPFKSDANEGDENAS